MTRALNLWRRFWLGPVAAAPLKHVRVGYGLLVLWYLYGNRWLIEGYFGHGRWLETSGLFEHISSLALSAVAPYDAVAVVQVLFGATAVAAAALAAGVLVVPAALVCFVLMATWVNLAQLSAGHTAGDLVLRALGFPLFCAAAAGHLAGKEREVPAWPLRLLQLQATLVYLVTGVARLESATWRDGQALCMMAMEPETVRLGGWLLCGAAGRVLSVAWPLGQVALAFLLWVPLGRRHVLIAALVLHALVAAAVRAPMDNEVMLVLLLAFTSARAPFSRA